MVCHGFLREDIVELVIELIVLPEVDVGASATVLAVNEEEHEIDVDFGGDIGIVRGLDAHAFAKLKNGPKNKTRTHTTPLEYAKDHVQVEEENESLEVQMARAKLKRQEAVVRR